MTETIDKADFIDKVHETIAVILILIAAGQAGILAAEFMSETGVMMLMYGSWLLKFLAAIMYVRFVWLYFKKRQARSQSAIRWDSFTNQIAMRAAVISAIVGVILLTMDQTLSQVPADNPAQFIAKFVQAAMFFAYGSAFLILNRDGGEA